MNPLAEHQSALVQQVMGRNTEVAFLEERLQTALTGERQLVFVTGEPGGKTALTDTFVHQLSARAEVRINHGQCIEQYGAGKADMPLLEAIGRLCQSPADQQHIALLWTYAPTWLAQLPFLFSPAERADLQRHGHPTSPRSSSAGQAAIQRNSHLPSDETAKSVILH